MESFTRGGKWLAVSRAEAFKEINMILVRGRQLLHDNHKEGPWVRMLVEAVDGGGGFSE